MSGRKRTVVRYGWIGKRCLEAMEACVEVRRGEEKEEEANTAENAAEYVEREEEEWETREQEQAWEREQQQQKEPEREWAWRGEIGKVKAEIGAEMKAIEERVRGIGDGEERKAERAAEWLAAVREKQKEMEGEWGAEEEESLGEAVEGAEEELAAGFNEAAVSELKGVYGRLEELEERWQEREAQREEVEERLEELADKVAANRVVIAVGLEGEELEEKVDVDYWSVRKHSRLTERVVRLREALRGRETSWERLRELEESTIPELEQELKEVVKRARQAVLRSQIRENIAEVVVEAMGEQGYELAGWGYERGDQRRDYGVRLESERGDEVEVVVEARGEGIREHGMELKLGEREERTGHEREMRAAEVRRALKRRGLAVGEMEVVGERERDRRGAERVEKRGRKREEKMERERWA